MSKDVKSDNQTRRKFIKHSFLGVAAGVGAVSLGPGVKEAKAENSNETWAGKADVLVVGSGIGGCASAIAAHEAGAKVLILEKAPKHFLGGNSSVSGGNFYAVPPEEYYENLMDMSSGRAEKTAIKTLADNAVLSIKWLGSIGVQLDWTKRKGYAVAPSRGRGAMKDLLKSLQDRGIEVLFETKAKRLLQDDRQRVIGLQAETKTGFMDIRAEKAVILATGGYLGNQEMVVRYIGPQANSIVDRGLPHITGDGHRMAYDLGADLVNMGDCRLAPMQPKSKASVSSFYSHGILVNKECQRFMDEAESSKNESGLGKAILKQTDGVGYIILDEKWKTLVRSSAQERFARSGGKLIEADSIEELADQLGLHPISLRQTIENFNAAVKEDKALVLLPPKTSDAVKLDKPKFYGTQVVNGSTLTFGGIRINKKCQAVNLEGKIIPRLYAVGILVGGIYYQNYKSGCGLASAATFGKLAGLQAAAEKPLS